MIVSFAGKSANLSPRHALNCAVRSGATYGLNRFLGDSSAQYTKTGAVDNFLLSGIMEPYCYAPVVELAYTAG